MKNRTDNRNGVITTKRERTTQAWIQTELIRRWDEVGGAGSHALLMRLMWDRCGRDHRNAGGKRNTGEQEVDWLNDLISSECISTSFFFYNYNKNFISGRTLSKRGEGDAGKRVQQTDNTFTVHQVSLTYMFLCTNSRNTTRHCL